MFYEEEEGEIKRIQQRLVLLLNTLCWKYFVKTILMDHNKIKMITNHLFLIFCRYKTIKDISEARLQYLTPSQNIDDTRNNEVN